MGFLLLLILCLFVLWYQVRYARRVEIRESHSRNYHITMRIISILFVLWGIFFFRSPEFILITILIGTIITFHPYTTGLSKSEIIYQPRSMGGFAGFAPKTQKISDISDIRIKENRNNLKLILSIRNQFKIEMNFAKEDQEKVFEYLHNAP